MYFDNTVNYSHQRGRDQIRIARISLVQTGTYNQMYMRPYTAMIEPHKLDDLTRRIDSAKVNKITGALFTGLASDIIKPSATPAGEVYIPNGWDIPRCRFWMEVHVMTSTGTEMIYYLQGFTDHYGVDSQSHVDPNMRFYINSFIKLVRQQVMVTGIGVTVQDRIVENAQVINGQLISYTVPDAALMRPADIFHGIQSSGLANSYASFGNGNFNDTRVTLGSGSERSSRINGIPSAYLARIVDSWNMSNVTWEFGNTNGDIYDRAVNNAIESPVSENTFIRHLSNVRGVVGATDFTLRDLAQLDPNVVNVVENAKLGPTVINQLHHQGQSEYWTQTTLETQWATTLSNAIVSLMMDCQIQHIAFFATNHTIGAVPVTEISAASSVNNQVMHQNYNLFINRLENEVFSDLSYMGNISYSVRADSVVFGDTKIMISLNSGPSFEFVTPSFCDGIIPPVLSGNREHLFAFSSEMDKLLNAVNQATPSNIPTLNGAV